MALFTGDLSRKHFFIHTPIFSSTVFESFLTLPHLVDN